MRAVKRRIREVQKELTLRQGFYVWLRRARRRNGSLEQYLDSVSRSGVPHVWPDLYRHAVADLPAEIRLPGTDPSVRVQVTPRVHRRRRAPCRRPRGSRVCAQASRAEPD